MDELRQALEDLRIALERYEHPLEEDAAVAAAVEVQDSLNALLESETVVCEGIVRLDVGKTGALLKIIGGTESLAKALRKVGA